MRFELALHPVSCHIRPEDIRAAIDFQAGHATNDLRAAINQPMRMPAPMIFESVAVCGGTGAIQRANGSAGAQRVAEVMVGIIFEDHRLKGGCDVD